MFMKLSAFSRKLSAQYDENKCFLLNAEHKIGPRGIRDGRWLQKAGGSCPGVCRSKGGSHSGNVVSSDTLKAAQQVPDDYRDLVVKVAGYNARFVDLHRELQDSIIARTEHGL